MSKKLHPLAAAIRAIDALSDNEKLAVRDYLRPAPKPRQKTTAAKCKHCQKIATAAVHVVGSNRYGHPFEPSTTATGSKTAQKRKAGKEATAITTDDDNPGTCGYRGCDLGPDENVHHMQSHPHYHEFGPASEASKGVGA